MENKFITIDGLELLVVMKGKNIIFELNNDKNDGKYRFKFIFDKNEFLRLHEFLASNANRIWKDFTPKEAYSIASDYDEYYDRELDNNGYLSIVKNQPSLLIEKPTIDNNRLYRFTKLKMETFIYDFNKAVNKL